MPVLVQKGMPVGQITDYLGQRLVEAKALESGIALFIRAVPSTVKGDTIVNVGVPVR